MAKQIVAWCDVHIGKDEQVPATSVRLAFDGAPMQEVDLCEPCIKELVEPLQQLLGDVGQPLAPIQSGSGSQVLCTQCGKPYKNHGSLVKHLRTVHNVTSDGQPIDGSAAKNYPCPECERTFDTPQGRGAHRSSNHGYVSPNSRDTQDALAV